MALGKRILKKWKFFPSILCWRDFIAIAKGEF